MVYNAVRHLSYSTAILFGDIMSKYDNLKYWAKVRARIPHKCQKCRATINKGDLYYKEKIDFGNPPPGFYFGELCEKCGTFVEKI